MLKGQHLRLPVEVCERVIGYVPCGYWRDEIATLVACSLVCRSWVPASHNQLYGEITLWGDLQTSQLLRTFKDHPGLGSFTEHLVIQIPTSDLVCTILAPVRTTWDSDRFEWRARTGESTNMMAHVVVAVFSFRVK